MKLYDGTLEIPFAPSCGSSCLLMVPCHNLSVPAVPTFTIMSAAHSDLSFGSQSVWGLSLILCTRGALHSGLHIKGRSCSCLSLPISYACAQMPCIAHMFTGWKKEGGTTQHPKLFWSSLFSPSPGCPGETVDQASQGGSEGFPFFVQAASRDTSGGNLPHLLHTALNH